VKRTILTAALAVVAFVAGFVLATSIEWEE
jgi:hypothetical protein